MSHRPSHPKHRLWLGAVAGLVLAGCASTPAPSGSEPASPTAKAKALVQNLVSRISPDTPLLAFERQHRQAAQVAAAQGRWADAQWEWDIVLALKPDDAEAKSLQAQAQGNAASAATAAVSRARQAQQRGEADAATRAYLEALTATPNDTAIADALRELERSRSRRGNAQGSKAMAAPMPTAKRAAAPRSNGGELDSNDLEHASMLASQGDVDGAIALLKPLSIGPRADANARNLLADLYVQQSDKLATKDRPGAIRALEACLQLVPGHRTAAARLRALRQGAAAPAASGVAAGAAAAASAQATSAAKPAPGRR